METHSVALSNTKQLILHLPSASTAGKCNFISNSEKISADPELANVGVLAKVDYDVASNLVLHNDSTDSKPHNSLESKHDTLQNSLMDVDVIKSLKSTSNQKDSKCSLSHEASFIRKRGPQHTFYTDKCKDDESALIANILNTVLDEVIRISSDDSANFSSQPDEDICESVNYSKKFCSKTTDDVTVVETFAEPQLLETTNSNSHSEENASYAHEAVVPPSNESDCVSSLVSPFPQTEDENSASGRHVDDILQAKVSHSGDLLSAVTNLAHFSTSPENQDLLATDRSNLAEIPPAVNLETETFLSQERNSTELNLANRQGCQIQNSGDDFLPNHAMVKQHFYDATKSINYADNESVQPLCLPKPRSKRKSAPSKCNDFSSKSLFLSQRFKKLQNNRFMQKNHGVIKALRCLKSSTPSLVKFHIEGQSMNASSSNDSCPDLNDNTTLQNSSGQLSSENPELTMKMTEISSLADLDLSGLSSETASIDSSDTECDVPSSSSTPGISQQSGSNCDTLSASSQASNDSSKVRLIHDDTVKSQMPVPIISRCHDDYVIISSGAEENEGSGIEQSQVKYNTNDLCGNSLHLPSLDYSEFEEKHQTTLTSDTTSDITPSTVTSVDVPKLVISEATISGLSSNGCDTKTPTSDSITKISLAASSSNTVTDTLPFKVTSDELASELFIDAPDLIALTDDSPSKLEVATSPSETSDEALTSNALPNPSSPKTKGDLNQATDVTAIDVSSGLTALSPIHCTSSPSITSDINVLNDGSSIAVQDSTDQSDASLTCGSAIKATDSISSNEIKEKDNNLNTGEQINTNRRYSLRKKTSPLYTDFAIYTYSRSFHNRMRSSSNESDVRKKPRTKNKRRSKSWIPKEKGNTTPSTSTDAANPTYKSNDSESKTSSAEDNPDFNKASATVVLSSSVNSPISHMSVSPVPSISFRPYPQTHIDIPGTISNTGAIDYSPESIQSVKSRKRSYITDTFTSASLDTNSSKRRGIRCIKMSKNIPKSLQEMHNKGKSFSSAQTDVKRSGTCLPQALVSVRKLVVPPSQPDSASSPKKIKIVGNKTASHASMPAVKVNVRKKNVKSLEISPRAPRHSKGAGSRNQSRVQAAELAKVSNHNDPSMKPSTNFVLTRKNRQLPSLQDSSKAVDDSSNLPQGWDGKTEKTELQSHNSRDLNFRYIPKLHDILSTVDSGVVTCCFCHLPANHVLGIGDLFGPYRPLAEEVLARQGSFNKHLGNPGLWNDVEPAYAADGSPKVTIDRDLGNCFITSRVQNNDLEVEKNSVEDFNRAIKKSSHHLRSLTTIDHVLQDTNCRTWRSKQKFFQDAENRYAVRIPGPKNECTTLPDKTLTSPDPSLPDINSIVFLEPKMNLSHSSNDVTMASPATSQTSPRHSRNSTSQARSPNHDEDAGFTDSTTVSISHRFSTRPLWTHGYCAVWADGVYAVRGQLYGLWDAMRDSNKHTCALCGRSGATIVTFEDSLDARMYGTQIKAYHYPCALNQKLKLNWDNLTANRPFS